MGQDGAIFPAAPGFRSDHQTPNDRQGSCCSLSFAQFSIRGQAAWTPDRSGNPALPIQMQPSKRLRKRFD
jgi:hypothetical protein